MNLFNPIMQGLSGALGIADVVSKFGAGRRMVKMQKEAWSREDNAVQRRMSDLKAAGLSPSLAAGSPAASSAPIAASQGEQMKGAAFSGKDELIMNSMRMKADIARSAAETERLRQEARKAGYEADMKEVEKDYMLGRDRRTGFLKWNLEGDNIENLTKENIYHYTDPYTRLERTLKNNLSMQEMNNQIRAFDQKLSELGVDKAYVEKAFADAAAKFEYEPGKTFNPVLLEWQIKAFEILKAIQEEGLLQADLRWFRKIGIGPQMLNAIMGIVGRTIPAPVMRVGR